MASVLRADRRARAGGPDLRGPPMGRPFAAGLHRLPAELVARLPDLRHVPGPTGHIRQVPFVGRRPTRRLDHVPRASAARGDGGALGRVGPRAAGTRADGDPRSRRGRAPVRDGDGAHAARPRVARGGGERVPPGRPHRGPGRPGDPARPDRRPAGRVTDGRADPPPGCGRCGQDVQCGGARCRVRPRGSITRIEFDHAGSQGGPGGTSRPSLAGARAVRLPPGLGPPGGVRDALQT